MKTRITLVILILLTFQIVTKVSYSIHPPEITGKISGTIKDENQNKAIEYVNVVLYNQADSSMITGIISDVNEQFSIENIPTGKNYMINNYKRKQRDNADIGAGDN